MRLLLIHQNFPAQFLPLARTMSRQGHEVVGIGSPMQAQNQTGARYLSCGGQPAREQRQGPTERRHLAQLAQGRRVARALHQLASEPWIPDLIVGHPCWGDLLFVDSVFPSVPLVAVMELDLLGVDLQDLEATLGVGLQNQNRSELALRAWTDLLAARRMVAGLTATQFQRATYPAWLRQRIVVMHEGVDIRACQPDPLAWFQLSAERSLSAADPVISFAARFLEPMRGFAVLMRAIPAVQRAIPGVQVVLAGNPVGTAYGPGPPAGANWKDALLQELDGQIQLSHVHFCGLLPHHDLIRLFQITTVHVYLTYPFVLSWSLMEAMASGALVVGSRTPPVEEVIRHGENGLLVGMDDPADLARQLIEVLRQPGAYRWLRHAARRSMAQHYERTACMERQIEWLQQLCRSE